jgi:hypothetical protein
LKSLFQSSLDFDANQKLSLSLEKLSEDQLLQAAKILGDDNLKRLKMHVLELKNLRKETSSIE